jgi:hypothetical protein
MATLKCLGPFARDELHAKSTRLRILEAADGAICPGLFVGHEDLQLANPLQPGDSNGKGSRADDCVRQPETLNQQGLIRKAAR